jgi:hypothetical protein
MSFFYQFIFVSMKTTSKKATTVLANLVSTAMVNSNLAEYHQLLLVGYERDVMILTNVSLVPTNAQLIS